MFSNLLKEIDSIQPFESTLSRPFLSSKRFVRKYLGISGKLRLRLNAPLTDIGDIYFNSRSAKWVRSRTKKGGGIHEPGIVKCLIALRRLSGPFDDSDFYDVGALHGYVTLVAASILRPRHVYAFEMNPHSSRLTVANLADNKGIGVDCSLIHAGVSDEQMSAVPCMFQSFALKVRPTPEERAELSTSGYEEADIDLITLDDFTQQRGCSPKVIKIDVEGSQKRILEGASTTLSSCRPYLFIESDAPTAINTDGTSMSEICRVLMDEYGYDIAQMDHRNWESSPVIVTRDMIASNEEGLERNRLLICVPRK